MPLSLFCGPPGAGKSYHAVCEIQRQNRDGRLVWTNVDGLKPDEFEHPELIHLMNDEELVRPWRHLPNDAMIVIDEAGVVFPADFGRTETTNKEDLNDLRKWVTQHRHQGQDIIIVVQDQSLVHRCIRAVADVRLETHNKGHIGMPKVYHADFYSPCKARKPFKSETYRYKLEVFRLYKSVDEGSMLATKKGKNILLRPVVIVPLLLILAGVGVVVIRGFSFTQAAASTHPQVAMPAASAGLPAPSHSNPGIQPPEEKKQPDGWRLAGVVRISGICLLMVQDGSRHKQIPATLRGWECTPTGVHVGGRDIALGDPFPEKI